MKISKIAIGDWIYHNSYGVGEVTRVDKRRLLGKKEDLLCVETKNSKFWIPIQDEPNERIRPVAKKVRFREIRQLLKKKPGHMDSSYRIRIAEINEIMAEGSILSLSRLYRDLSARRKRRNQLSPSEESIREKIEKRLEREWAVVMDISEEKAHEKLIKSLSMGLEKVQAA